MLYPNPTKETLNIKNINLNESEIFITDILGKKINYESKINGQIDVSSLAKGVYTLTIFTKYNELISKKFTKH